MNYNAIYREGATEISYAKRFSVTSLIREREYDLTRGSEKSKIIYVSGLCGLLPAGPGHSHQSVRDIGLMGNIPNIDIFHPGSLNDLKYIFDYALNISQKSTYI